MLQVSILDLLTETEQWLDLHKLVGPLSGCPEIRGDSRYGGNSTFIRLPWTGSVHFQSLTFEIVAWRILVHCWKRFRTRPHRAVNFRGELLTSGIETAETEEMAKPIIGDELWTLIEPLLPSTKPRREKNPGRLPVSNRAAVTGILFVLKTGLRWRDLLAEMGNGSGVTCWRRLRDWQAASVQHRSHVLLLAELRAADQNFSRVAVDSSSIRAVGASQKLRQTSPIARDSAPSTTSSPMSTAPRSSRS